MGNRMGNLNLNGGPKEDLEGPHGKPGKELQKNPKGGPGGPEMGPQMEPKGAREGDTDMRGSRPPWGRCPKEASDPMRLLPKGECPI
jgi:hypothetical protein